MAANQVSFSVSYDQDTKLHSSIISGLICGIAIFVALLTKSATVAAIVVSVAVVVLVLAYGYSPRGYVVSDDSIAVKRLFGAAEIPLAGVRDVRRAGAEDFRDWFKLYGNCGLFGYYGTFWTTKLGESRWFLTNRSKAIVVAAKAGTVLVSPDDTDAFITAIRSSGALPPAARSASLNPAASRRGGG